MEENQNLPVMTREELEKYNGLNGMPHYIAYKGKIYDVTTSPLWRDGMHFEHYAGDDLTEEIAGAPHGEEVLEEFPVVALLKEDTT